jgi:hypothetical protein
MKKHITYCKAQHCTWAAEPGRLMCLHHWRLLPTSLQADVLNTWKANPTAAQSLTSVPYLEAAASAIEYIAEKEGRPTHTVYRTLAARVRNKEIKTCL